MSETPQTDAAVVADLADRAADRTMTPHTLTPETSIFVARVRTDESIEDCDLERYLDAPRRPRGSATLHHPADFVDYVRRVGSESETTMWADVPRGAVTAVLNDHAASAEAGWRDHTVSLALQPDPDWERWIAKDRNTTGNLMSQGAFAEHIEELIHTIVEPDAATLYEVVTTLQATKKANFRSATKVKSGDHQFMYDTSTEAKAGTKGALEIPDEFWISVSPWERVASVRMKCLLRFRISDEGQLTIGYVLHRPDRVKRDAFEGVLAVIAEAGKDTRIPLHYGATPRFTG